MNNDSEVNSIVALGIDQGIANVGFGLTTLNDIGDEVLLHSGVFRTYASNSDAIRIFQIFEFINKLIHSYNVDVIGLEKLFFNLVEKTTGRNRSASIMRTQMVSGAIYLLGGIHQLPVADYTPGTVKKICTGNGRASKDDVVKRIEEIAQKSGIVVKNNHEADAVGISLTALRKHYEAIEQKKRS